MRRRTAGRIVRVEGLSKADLEARLKELLEAKWLKNENAQVSVFIKEYQSKRVARHRGR